MVSTGVRDDHDKQIITDPVLFSEMYRIIANRRLAYDNLSWQVPALSLTAQAFLFTISLAPSTSQAGRTIASLLAIFISFASIQLLERHSFFETATSIFLENFERKNGISINLDQIGIFYPHQKYDNNDNIMKSNLFKNYKRPFLSRFSSRIWWIWLLRGMISVSGIIILITWCFPGLLK